MFLHEIAEKATLVDFFRNEYRKISIISTSSPSNRKRKPPIGVGISNKSMVGFEGLWANNNFCMGDFICVLLRLDVKEPLL